MPKISENYEKRSEIEVKIGNTLRRLRTLMGYSQVKVASAIGVTFQQFQKYECGINRLCVSRLIEICKFCNVSLAQFFDSMIIKEEANDNEGSGFKYEAIDNKETLSLIRIFNSIKNPDIRTKVVSLVKVIAKSETETDQASYIEE